MDVAAKMDAAEEMSAGGGGDDDAMTTSGASSAADGFLGFTSDFRRGKRFRKLVKLLATSKAQATIQR